MGGQPATFLLQEGMKPGSYEAGAVTLAFQAGAKGKVGAPRIQYVPIVQTTSTYGKMMGGAQKGWKGGRSAAAYVGTRVDGYFKSFNVEKGWGFLKSEHFEDDLFVSYKLAPTIQYRG